MTLLQMGTQELQAYVEKVLMENPTLELESSEQRPERPELLQKMDWLMASDRQNHWYHQEDARNLAEYVATSDEENLYEHLRRQLNTERLPIRLRLAVDCVLSGLNHNGYLEESPAELSVRCGQPEEIVRQAEALVRSAEPAGVGARTLSECLALQLERTGNFGLELLIVQKYLEEVAKNHYSLISRQTGAGREEIQSACRIIRALDPKPGARFAPREAPGYIIPDLLVTEENGQLSITPGDEFLPVLKVSSYYQNLMKNTDDPEVKTYLEDKVQQAISMVKSIDQRRSTLLNCATLIVEFQRDFFRNGLLQPLTLADIAERMDVHESTVSRAIKSKYIQCSRGTFPLSHFFSRSLPAAGGEVSSAHVKTLLQDLIDHEDRHKPLSDQKLCDILAAQKIGISRRTLAKYREEMGIPSTSGRKEF